MLDISFVQILSIFLLVGTIGRFGMLAFFTRKREELGSIKASTPAGFILHEVWLFLDLLLPLIFYLLGAVMPSWVYGTILNLSFNYAEFLQVLSVPLFLSGLVLLGWSERALGQFMRPRIEVMEKHDLVTGGAYSRMRHPTYTGIMMITAAGALLFLHIVLVVGFVAILAIAYKKAVLEEELLTSEKGFGDDYKNYMSRTGRFLPRLTRPAKATDDGGLSN
jgi:protein-S-isoprenylcysteine O-methyltransferase Ste14